MHKVSEMCDDFFINIENLKKFTSGDGDIVLVDDDYSQITLVKACYEKSGRKNELICIDSSEDCIKYFSEVLEKKKPIPELLLLDINMPLKSGFDVLSEIKSKKQFQKNPVIIMFSSSENEADIVKSKKLHADAFFSKPINIAEYISFFKKV